MKTKIFTLITFAILSLCNAYSQVGIGTTEPEPSAALDIEATDKGLLPPRMDTDARDDISSPAEGLMIYNTDKNCLQFYDGRFWISTCDGVADVPTVIGANGVVWMDRNLGASQVATSSTDGASYGDLYQWGRAADGHQKRDSPTYDAVLSTDGVANFDNDPANAWDGEFILRNSNSGANNWVDPTVPGVDDLWQGVNGTNNPCPAGFRVPSQAEWQAEIDNGNWSNATDAFDSPLKLPVAGYRDLSSGSLFNVGSNGYYWSSTVSSSNASVLLFGSSFAFMSSNPRALGNSIRCLKD